MTHFLGAVNKKKVLYAKYSSCWEVSYHLFTYSHWASFSFCGLGPSLTPAIISNEIINKSIDKVTEIIEILDFFMFYKEYRKKIFSNEIVSRGLGFLKLLIYFWFARRINNCIMS